LRFPNVIVTPHVAYNTHEAVARIIKTTIENIEAFAKGSPQNLIV
jgi:D-lactate dehydrogenase